MKLKAKSYFIKTFGCQMNTSDSERIAGFLESMGFRPAFKNNKADLSAEALAKADLVVFNTCGVRKSAEDRVYGQIHNIRKKEEGSKKKEKKTIVLTGCLANRKDVISRLKDKVDIFFPINDMEQIIHWLEKIKKQKSKVKMTIQNSKLIRNSKFDIQNSFKLKCDYLKILPKYSNKFSAYVPIMTGCNNFCSYCVVPYARGPEISRPAKDIIREIKKLVKNGSKEIILLGQNVNSYQFIDRNSSADEADTPFEYPVSKPITFPELLRTINNIPGNFWISFMSNHPKDFSDELIEAATKLKKVCECVHLPLQAGDNRILQRMNRKYTSAQYLKLIEKIHAAFKKHKPEKLYSITSDIIVGFPGETKKQFLKSADIMKKAGYDMVYFGQFSPRPGTAAWKMKDNITKKEKERREKFLNEILKKTALGNNKKYLGKTVDVLIDRKKFFRDRISKDNFIYFGHTRTYKNAKVFSRKKNLIGKIAKVKITKITPWNLQGTTI